MPPQHGKSFGASKILPTYMLGVNPDLSISIASYSFALARKFGQGIQQTLDSEKYKLIFPETYLKAGQGSASLKESRTAQEFQCVGRKGGVKLVGREGSLTGNRVDIMILDDLYKDAMEANSPLIRENIWSWYNSVVRTRLHNDSQELIVFTRWHEQDLIGRIEECEKVIDIDSIENIDMVDKSSWIKVNFQAIKTDASTAIDPRLLGEPLWPQRHSLELLKQRKAMDSKVFEALYQGNPISAEGLLYTGFLTYDKLPKGVIKNWNYTDTADTGKDYLCSVCYSVCLEGNIYITDVVYSQLSMEHTEKMVADMLCKQRSSVAVIESNNGGRGFARAIARLLTNQNIDIRNHNQRQSKISRILTNATAVQRLVFFPDDWTNRWIEFAKELNNFRSCFSANTHDDAADTITAIIEQEMVQNNAIKRVCFS